MLAGTLHYGPPAVGYAIAVVLVLVAAIALRIWASPLVAHSAPFLFFYPAIALTSLLGGMGPGLAAIIAVSAFGLWGTQTIPVAANWISLFLLGPLMAIGFPQIRRMAIEGRAAAREVARFKYVGDHATDTILLVDDSGRILYANLMAGWHFGRPVEKLTGQLLVSLLPEGQREALRDALAFTRSGAPKTIDIILQRPGSLPHLALPLQLEMACTGVWTDGQFVVHIAGRDITERLRIERRLNELRHWESLGGIAGGMARDFNHLLSVILRNAARVRDNVPSGDENEVLLSDVIDAGERSAELIQLMIATAGYRSPTVEWLHPGLILDGVLSTRPLPDDVRVSISAAPEVFPGDRRSLETLFRSLISNAAESYGGLGGDIRIVIRPGRMEPLPANLTGPELRFEEGTAAGDCLCVIVEDRGSGMNPEVLSRAFDPFFSTRMTGRGLGLPAVRGIVRAYSGALRLTTLAGSGTRVEVWLPRTDRAMTLD